MNLLESWKDRLDERICHLEGTKGVSLRLRFDDKLGEGRFAFLFFSSTETSKGKYLHAYPNRIIASLRRSYFSNLFQAFESIPNRSVFSNVRARPRENSSECKYSSRIRILIKDNSIESRKGRQQRTLGFFCGGIFRGSCDDDHHPSISNVPARIVAHALLFIRIVT